MHYFALIQLGVVPFRVVLGQPRLGHEEHLAAVFGGPHEVRRIQHGPFIRFAAPRFGDPIFRFGDLQRARRVDPRIHLRSVPTRSPKRITRRSFPAARAADPSGDEGGSNCRRGEEHPRTVSGDRLVRTPTRVGTRSEPRAAAAHRFGFASRLDVHELRLAARRFAQRGASQDTFRAGTPFVALPRGRFAFQHDMTEIARTSAESVYSMVFGLRWHCRNFMSYPPRSLRNVEGRDRAPPGRHSSRAPSSVYVEPMTSLTPTRESSAGSNKTPVDQATAHRARDPRARYMPIPFDPAQFFTGLNTSTSNPGARERPERRIRFEQERFTRFRGRATSSPTLFNPLFRRLEHIAPAFLRRRGHELIRTTVRQPRNRRRQRHERPIRRKPLRLRTPRPR